MPEALHSKELEGNLVILRNGAICYYQDFVNIDRSFWNLLPMGLYADTLIQGKATRDGENPLLFSREMQLTVPFGRNKTAFDKTLIQRMLVNYYILVSEWHMNREEYDAKDKTVDSVVHHYSELQLNDKELVSLARYLSAYSRMDEADSLLAPRASRIDVSENLLLYYLNLKLFNPSFYETDQFESLVLNAVSINRKRFCKLFSSINKGGVSFQLLEYEVLRDMHCEYCKP